MSRDMIEKGGRIRLFSGGTTPQMPTYVPVDGPISMHKQEPLSGFIKFNKTRVC